MKQTKNSFLIYFLAFLLTVCAPQISFSQNAILTGAEQPALYLPLLQGKRVGFVGNQTSILPQSANKHAVDFLLEKGIQVKKVFVPEHGFRGTADAGEKVDNSVDQKTGLPIISLYGNNKKPTSAQIADLDVVIFDLQDVGTRFSPTSALCIM